jgi:DNA-binding MarR family transcriptional regulator
MIGCNVAIVDEPDDGTKDLAMRFLRVFEYMGKFAKHRQPSQPNHIIRQLHLNQMHMLGLLQRDPGISQKDLAERMQLTPAAVSTSVREMVGYGLVDRLPDPDDARLMRLHLSQYGRQLFDEAQRMRCASMADLLSALPLEEQHMIVEALERALDAKMGEIRTEDQS